MNLTRRQFIRTSGALGAGITAGPTAAIAAVEGLGASSAPDTSPSSAKNFLFLGGTGFIGPNMVRYAVERGHNVTIFTRGRSETELPDSVERLVGDRNDDLSALEGRSWDVVFDNNTYDYRWVERSTELLKDAVGQYIFVSSISAYDTSADETKDPSIAVWKPVVDENYTRFSPDADWKNGDDAPYGLMKRLSEDIAHKAFPGRTTVVRPGLIVGPGDPTDRFTYWPRRIEKGGEVLAPGNPDHSNQIIDQRDLTEWIVRLAENGTMGNFNGTGPGTRMSMAEMLYGVRASVSSDVQFTWVPESFLTEQEIAPWSDLPAWAPGDVMFYVSVRKAVEAGLTFRPLAVTTRDLLEWDKTRPDEERQSSNFGMSRDRELEVLSAWHDAKKMYNE